MKTLTYAGLAAASLLLAAPCATAQDLQFQLINASSHAVVFLFTSPSNEAAWREDLLGDQVLPAGGSATVDIFDGSEECLYDFRIIFENETELVQPGIDICDVSELTISDAS